MQTKNGAMVTPHEFRAACGLFPTGVTVVTRRMSDGRPYGMTVSSFTSVSLDPPLILVCIEHGAGFLQDLAKDLPFAINVLNEHQQHLSILFSKNREEERFLDTKWEPGWSGVPLIPGAVVHFGCSLERTVEGGDHLILIAAVRQIRRHRGRPLVWCDRGYHCLPIPEPSGV